jgi:hypothetical protein
MNLRLTILMAGLLSGSIAFAAPTDISFASLGGQGGNSGVIEFDNSQITFPNFTGTPGTGFDFTVQSCAGCSTTLAGLDGNIDGTFNIGTITTSGSYSQAAVTGSGTFSITDPTGVFTANLTWDDISGNNFGSGLNQLNGDVNVTGATYTGTNADLIALQQLSSGVALLNFTFTSSTSLATLKNTSTPIYDNYSGNYAPVPEPTFYGLLGLGVVGAIWANQRNKKTA